MDDRLVPDHPKAPTFRETPNFITVETRVTSMHLGKDRKFSKQTAGVMLARVRNAVGGVERMHPYGLQYNHPPRTGGPPVDQGYSKGTEEQQS
ncbi:unnamed protein product [Tuber aestivum]|uniref:Uncharacterized protein n=1 Tax=Tuber aestivum TaxID=59557 RepID=A0A292Q6B2_9PEZI|nr:unnamed protein product [Tuber aestivum]